MLAEHLHVDVDEVRSWTFEKQARWFVALGIIADRREKEMDTQRKTAMMNNDGSKGFVRNGDKVTVVG